MAEETKEKFLSEKQFLSFLSAPQRDQEVKTTAQEVWDAMLKDPNVIKQERQLSPDAPPEVYILVPVETATVTSVTTESDAHQ